MARVRGKRGRNRAQRGSSGESSIDLPGMTEGSREPLSLSDLLREHLGRIDDATNTTLAQQLVEALIKEALGGNVRALVEIFDRIDQLSTGKSSAAVHSSVVCKQTVSRILEALCDRNDNMPSD